MNAFSGAPRLSSLGFGDLKFRLLGFQVWGAEYNSRVRIAVLRPGSARTLLLLVLVFAGLVHEDRMTRKFCVSVVAADTS